MSSGLRSSFKKRNLTFVRLNEGIAVNKTNSQLNKQHPLRVSDQHEAKQRTVEVANKGFNNQQKQSDESFVAAH